MRKGILILTIILMAMPESRGQRQAGNDDIITVDVRKSYSQKKELILQDFMDVEYVKLETNDVFLHQGIVMDIGKRFIVYDLYGKFKRSFKHRGGTRTVYYINVFNFDRNNLI